MESGQNQAFANHRVEQRRTLARLHHKRKLGVDAVGILLALLDGHFDGLAGWRVGGLAGGDPWELAVVG